ncbi:MAG: GAF domain-containing protein, partial [Gallionella sp.]
MKVDNESVESLRDEQSSMNKSNPTGSYKALLQDIIEGVPIRIFWKDRDSRYLGCNTLFAKDAGLDHPRELAGKTDFDLGWKDQAELYRADDKLVMESEYPRLSYEEPSTTPDGKVIWLRTSKVPLRDASRRIIGILGIYENITEYKLAEFEQQRLTRALKLLSKCNTVLVHAENEEELLTKICHLTVEIGGYLMAWVGFAEDDATKSVQPVAQSGYEEGYLDNVNVTWANTELGQGPTGTSIRTGETIINQEYQSNPISEPWRKAAVKRGYQSSIALPLVVNKRALGAFTIYSSEPHAFIP